jgi:hypothetical protein
MGSPGEDAMSFWTILHGIIAIGLPGAARHQGLTVWREPALHERFIDRLHACAPAPDDLHDVGLLVKLDAVTGSVG